MRFIVASYGIRYIGMLATLLYSIRQTHPQARATILWQDVPVEVMSAIQNTYPTFDFHMTALDLSGSRQVRISSKPILWQMGYNSCSDKSVVLLDVDMLVTGDVGQYFRTELSWDMGITHKPEEHYPLNTGAILLRRGEGVARLLVRWLDVTLNVVNDAQRMEAAHSRMLPYGAADQMSLYEILGYENARIDYLLKMDGYPLRVHAFPCRELNQTKSAPLLPKTRIVHYKAGWQRVLLDGYDFSTKRPRKDSWPMYIHYLRTFQKAMVCIRECTGTVPKSLANSIYIPYYLNSHLKERIGIYPVFAMWSQIRWKAMNLARAFRKKMIQRKKGLILCQ